MFETLLTSKQKNIEISMDLLDKGVVHTDRLTQIIDDLLQLSKLETTVKLKKTQQTFSPLLILPFNNAMKVPLRKV